MSDEARTLTDVVTRLRRALRTSIRADWPWESLPMAQVELLQTLAERPPMKVGDLAAILKLAPNTVSGLVSQLIDSGLVVRGGDPKDRRVARLSVSPRGHEQLLVWQREHEKRIGAALGKLEASEREDVVRRSALAAALGLVALPPLLVQDRFWLDLLILVWIYTVFAVGLSLLFGYAHLISFGHGGFFAVGAYCSALLSLPLAALANGQDVPDDIHKASLHDVMNGLGGGR